MEGCHWTTSSSSHLRSLSNFRRDPACHSWCEEPGSPRGSGVPRTDLLSRPVTLELASPKHNGSTGTLLCYLVADLGGGGADALAGALADDSAGGGGSGGGGSGGAVLHPSVSFLESGQCTSLFGAAAQFSIMNRGDKK